MYNDRTKIVAVIGRPVRPTPTPSVLNSIFSRRRINFVSLAFEPPTAAIAVAACRELAFAGAAITLPFKESVLKLVDRIDPHAKSIGAANTISIRSNRLVCHNTDWMGFLNAVGQRTLKNAVCVILGAGGAARAAAYAARSAHAEVHVLNRSAQRAKRLLRDLRIRSPYSSLKDLRDIKYDILVNATSVGLYDPSGCIVPPAMVRPRTLVVDFVFEPVHTALLHTAHNRECKVVNGISILAEQAVEQIRIWTGAEVSAADLEQQYQSEAAKINKSRSVK